MVTSSLLPEGLSRTIFQLFHELERSTRTAVTQDVRGAEVSGTGMKFHDGLALNDKATNLGCLKFQIKRRLFGSTDTSRSTIALTYEL